MNTGLLIALEGVDGSGKTTQMEYIESQLIKQNIEVVKTREPGGTPIALQIREILVNENTQIEPLNRVAQLLLFYAARIQNLQQVIIPALQQNKVVIVDRFLDSTIVLQGLLNGLQDTINEITSVPSLSYLKERPDHVIFFDVTPEISRSRATNRNNLNSLDIEYLSKKSKPIDLFRVHFQSLLISETTNEIHYIDANHDIQNVQNQLDPIIQYIIKKQHTSKFIDRI